MQKPTSITIIPASLGFKGLPAGLNDECHLRRADKDPSGIDECLMDIIAWRIETRERIDGEIFHAVKGICSMGGEAIAIVHPDGRASDDAYDYPDAAAMVSRYYHEAVRLRLDREYKERRTVSQPTYPPIWIMN